MTGLAKGTLVHTTRGNIPVEGLLQYDEVLDIYSNILIVDSIVKRSIQPLITFKTSFGNILEVTKDQEVLVRYKQKFISKKAKKIKLRDNLAYSLTYLDYKFGTPIDSISYISLDSIEENKSYPCYSIKIKGDKEDKFVKVNVGFLVGME